jgi:hypothetical protein
LDVGIQRRGPAPTVSRGRGDEEHHPELGVILDGAIMQIGPGTHVHDELYALCLVLDDGSPKGKKQNAGP